MSCRFVISLLSFPRLRYLSPLLPRFTPATLQTAAGEGRAAVHRLTCLFSPPPPRWFALPDTAPLRKARRLIAMRQINHGAVAATSGAAEATSGATVQRRPACRCGTVPALTAASRGLCICARRALPSPVRRRCRPPPGATPETVEVWPCDPNSYKRWKQTRGSAHAHGPPLLVQGGCGREVIFYRHS